MDIRAEIVSVIRQVGQEGNKSLVDGLADDTVLLQSGLDSLDFAIVVARLEESLDMDPFSVMEQPVYPRTLGEFVAIYQRFCPERS